MAWYNYVPGGSFVHDMLTNPNGQAASQANQQARQGLLDNANRVGGFANSTQSNYNTMTPQVQQAIAALTATAGGQNSVALDQLRQALSQNMAAQHSMAAGAGPQNAAMAQRQAMINSARLGGQMAGQAATAGLQERQNAQNSLGQLLLGARGQELQGTLGGFQGVNQAYGSMINPTGDQSWSQQNSALLSAGAGALAASDRRLKKDIKDGDGDASSLLEGLKAYSYTYKDSRYGKGKQLGVMAQDLERVAPDAVIDTPSGKMVHGAKLAGALAAAMPGLHKRLKALEAANDNDDEDTDE